LKPAASHGGLILVHGGAGSRALSVSQRACLAEALVTGHDLLRRGGPALGAVEQAIRVLEDSGLFNAGAGARRQLDGRRRMDAALMEGCTLRAGAVAAIEDVRFPIAVARLVMDRTGHVLLVGPLATRFARHFGVEREAPAPREKFRPRPTRALDRRAMRLYREMVRRHRLGTVGAVALDRRGDLAAGASTGGIAAMLPGRVGDTPLIGCGVYADNTAGAVSMTGWGEGIMRIAVAKEIVDRMAAGASPARAARATLDTMAARLQDRRAQAGALVLAPGGRWVIRHTTPRMSAGWFTGNGTPVVRDRFL
jgi:beta-aspartyl-peptidase (threonine type)